VVFIQLGRQHAWPRWKQSDLGTVDMDVHKSGISLIYRDMEHNSDVDD